MSLEKWVALAREQGASDLHLEPGLPLALRVRGTLRLVGEPLRSAYLTAAARQVVGEAHWEGFLTRRSHDLSRQVAGVRCRIHVLCSARGVGFSVRLLHAFSATVKGLNLHPDLKKLIGHESGLILVSGPTGSGKTSTVCALLQEVNVAEVRHIVTVESPIEHALVPRKSLIRQREVGRDTPSFEQALIDAMREDPDVLMVGEMRDPQTMRLTLNAAETGHLVLATLHSATSAEALQRLVSSFPAEIQPAVCSQLADCLVAVICQRLSWREEVGLRVPELEVLMASTPVRAIIRQGAFYKLPTALESGGAEGCWSFARYHEWLERRTEWARPEASTELAPELEGFAEEDSVTPEVLALPRPGAPEVSAGRVRLRNPARPSFPPAPPEEGVYVLGSEEVADDLSQLIEELEQGGGPRGGRGRK